MDRRNDTAVEAILEHLIEQGPGGIAGVFARAFELAMQIERERFLGAGHYERTPERRGYANGTKPKRIDTPAGTVNVQVPKTAGHEGEPFYLDLSRFRSDPEFHLSCLSFECQGTFPSEG
jgi:transposase-like protein